MRNAILMTVSLALGGCAHVRGQDVANVIVLAAFLAVEANEYAPPPPPVWCADDEVDPPHTCPGTAPAPPPK
jgi:hypothetical protein